MIYTPNGTPGQIFTCPSPPSPHSPFTVERQRPDRFRDAPLSPLVVTQLNCHVSKAVTLSTLNEYLHADVLILQEPWVNPYDFTPPLHPAWRAFTAFEHLPKVWAERHKTAIFVKRTIPSSVVYPLPGGSQCLVAVGFDFPGSSFWVVNVYNPTPSFSLVPLLASWLSSNNDCLSPTLICMDSNLHHPHWNPLGNRKKEPKAESLLSLFSSSGFCFASPKHVPTFYSCTGNGFTIDHVWANFLGHKLISNCVISDNNCGSDHQLIRLDLALHKPPPPFAGALQTGQISPSGMWIGPMPIWLASEMTRVCPLIYVLKT